MSDSPNQWVGQIVDAKFPLQQFLGGTNHSAVFLTQLPGSPTQTAALKLIQVRSVDADLQLTRWREAAQLSHPNLLEIFDSGRCEVSGMNFLYVVTEHAPEDLSQILPDRALTPHETREMLQPVLDGLAYLHQKNLLHGHITPSNILAINDQVKLSADSMFPAGEARVDSRELDAYDAPELSNSSASVPADVFSLAATIVEVLTQKPPLRQDTLEIDPTFSPDLSEPFLEIARRSLRLDPTRRWTIEGISAHLNPQPALAVAAGASPAAAPGNSSASVSTSIPVAAPSPLAIPLSYVAPLPAAKLPEPKSYSISQESKRTPQTASTKPRLLLPALATILFLAALFIVPKFLNHRAYTSTSIASTESAHSETVSTPANHDPKSSQPKAKTTTPPTSAHVSTPAPAPLQPASSKERLDRAPSDIVATPPVIPTPRSATNAPDSAPIAKSSSSPAPHGEVLDQVLPQVSDKARSTIQGKVRVAVKVHVDPSGNVSQAELDSAGPSPFFADLALQAARKWEFTSPEVDGHSVPSAWLIRFEISPSDTKAFPSQVNP